MRSVYKLIEFEYPYFYMKKWVVPSSSTSILMQLLQESSSIPHTKTVIQELRKLRETKKHKSRVHFISSFNHIQEFK